jgi:hypothetical protein
VALNDQCEQFNHADSYHQHCEGYRIVIEPMPPLYIHDAPPCSSIHMSDLNRESSYLCRFELLDESSEMPRHRTRKGIVLVLQALPDC